MTGHKGIDTKIDELFDAHKHDRADALKHFIDSLKDSYSACRKAEGRNFALMIVVWLSATLVAFDAISEVGISTVKLKNIKILVLLAAPAIGFFAYNMIVLFARAANLWKALRQCYKHWLPKAYELDLEDFTLPVSFFDLGRTSMSSSSSSTQNFWFFTFLVVALVLPGALILHVGFLLFADPFAPFWIRATSATVGFAFWIYGLWHFLGNVSIDQG